MPRLSSLEVALVDVSLEAVAAVLASLAVVVTIAGAVWAGGYALGIFKGVVASINSAVDDLKDTLMGIQHEIKSVQHEVADLTGRLDLHSARLNRLDPDGR